MSGVPLKAAVLLADDHQLVRHGVRLVIDAEPDLEVVAEAGDGAEALEIALHRRLDLAVLDVAMPRLTGLQVARHLREHRPAMKVLILSMHDNEQFFHEALDAGASGYVLKTGAHEELVAACRAALRGETFRYPAALDPQTRRRLDRGAPEDPLTPREAEVVKLIAEGLSGREIAEVLSISEHTVERHRANVLEKLDLRDRVALTRYAVRRGLIEP
jgi:DNA-binding NarL/FixJ family response regulator